MNHERMPQSERVGDNYENPAQLAGHIHAFLGDHELQNVKHSPDGMGEGEVGKYVELRDKAYESLEEMATAAGGFEQLILKALNE